MILASILDNQLDNAKTANSILIHKLWKIQFWKKLFAIGLPYKHWNFWLLYLPIKMALKTVVRPINNNLL